ncbi:MAG: hypothetical protein ACHQF2_03800 [Flavobacteriales bacterium]
MKKMTVPFLLVYIAYASTTGCGSPTSPSDTTAVHAGANLGENLIETNLTYNPDTQYVAVPIDTLYYNLHAEINGSYQQVKDYCLQQRNQLARNYTATDSANRDTVILQAKKLLERLLLNGMFHHWYGTEWDFNGYTAIPRNGKVACGYFISTTLRHAGFNLNRYKMAQQTGLSGARTLRFDDSIYYFKNTEVESTRKKLLATLTEGLYFAGLSFHVGYLLIRKNEVFFIHSNYIDAKGVMMEKLIDSEAFAQTTGCYVVNVSGNRKLLEKWIKNDTIPIITDKDLR